MPPDRPLRVKFWGTRGSIPVAMTSAEVRRKLISALMRASGRRLETPEQAAAFLERELDFAVSHTFGGNSSCVQLDAGSTDYACLILDVDLPGMSGVGLQKNLIESETEIPVIFISGECDEATRRHVLNAGAAGFFRKPFSLEPLLAAVRSIACLSLT